MNQKKWNGLLKIKEFLIEDKNGKILYEARNIKNMFHDEGQRFLLQAAFVGGSNSSFIPSHYYLGLDNRTNVSSGDTIESIIGEPIGNGYERVEMSSTGEFAVNFENGAYTANSPIVSFRATVGSWGPCRNLFLTCVSNGSPILIATAVLPSPTSVDIGNNVTMRISMQLKDCD